MADYLKYCKFGELDFEDSFFDSLKKDYPRFTKWFEKKVADQEKAYVHYNKKGSLSGFLYLKVENREVNDVEPPILANNIVKIGTFKIDSHGTRQGERFLKKAFDYCIYNSADVCYVTLYSKQEGLIKLFQKYGFVKHGEKEGNDVEGNEIVMIKRFDVIVGDIFKDYPMVDSRKTNKHILSIYPKYHSVMFPDSILKTENTSILSDVTYTNSIHKTYVCRMEGTLNLSKGDILVVYRTAEKGKSAEYNSVATSICVVESVRSQLSYKDFETFYSDVSTYSIFDKEDLRKWYDVGGCIVIKMTYNIALNRRITRHDLIEKIGVPRNGYWGYMKIDDEIFDKIVKAGEVNESFIIH
nr:MAG TPA: helix-turn-helix domain-containing protein [Caudoviricetes sp.]